MIDASGYRLLFCCLAAGLTFGCIAGSASAQHLRVGDICRVKGQEANSLHGLGLVVGLDGTGDTETPTIRALAKVMELMGNPLGRDNAGQPDFSDLENAKNVALVMVTATVPAEGARQGDQLNCEVNALSASSLEGGYLMLTPLVGPHPHNPQLYAFCHGPIALDQRGPSTTGKIRSGCRMEVDVTNQFEKDGKITLVLDNAHAGFRTAYEVVDALNNRDGYLSGGAPGGADGAASDVAAPRARAVDQLNIEVSIAPEYRPDPVSYVAELLDERILVPPQQARVVIDKRSGVVVVGDSVLVGRVAVSHNNIAVQTGADPGDRSFVIVPEDSETTTPRLDALVNSLNALKVSTDDIIAIIENLYESGALYGKLHIR